MRIVPDSAVRYAIEESCKIADGFLDKYVYEEEPVVIEQNLFWKEKGIHYYSVVAICFFMDDYMAKIKEIKIITENEYVNLYIEHFLPLHPN